MCLVIRSGDVLTPCDAMHATVRLEGESHAPHAKVSSVIFVLYAADGQAEKQK
jgi:hypothetical protein